MTNLQEIFDDCLSYYNDSYETIDAMARIVSKTNDSCDPNDVLIRFDVLLQYSLLEVAAADFELDKRELVFIKNITRKGDLLELLSSAFNIKITWENLYHASVNDVRSLLRQLNEGMINVSWEFARVFALCDSVTIKDYAGELRDNVSNILMGLARVDGIVTESELNQNCLLLNVISGIYKLKE